jgi:hypothetical protein
MILEILPHPKRGTSELGSERIFPIGVEIRAASGSSDERPMVTVLGTDGSEDRHGSVINPRGWETEPYMRNPVALWAHGVTDMPAVGKTLALRSAGGKWEFDIEFLVGPWRNMSSNLAQFLYEAYRDGMMQAVSVSFIPKEWKEREASTVPSFFAENVEYMKQELTEISFVNVGSNRNALQKALDRAKERGTISDMLVRLVGMEGAMRMSSPIIVSAPKPAPESAKKPTRTLAELRKEISSVVARCCDPYGYGTAEPVSPEVQAAEIATINAIAEAMLNEIAIGMTGWASSEHEELRSLCAGLVSGGMYLFDRMATMLDRWYEGTLSVPAPAIDLTNVDEVVSDAAPSAFTRDRALVDALKQLRAKLDVMLEDEPQPKLSPNVIKILGDLPAGSGAGVGQPFRVAATDAPAPGAGARSTPKGQTVIDLILTEK